MAEREILPKCFGANRNRKFWPKSQREPYRLTTTKKKVAQIRKCSTKCPPCAGGFFCCTTANISSSIESESALTCTIDSPLGAAAEAGAGGGFCKDIFPDFEVGFPDFEVGFPGI